MRALTLNLVGTLLTAVLAGSGCGGSSQPDSVTTPAAPPAAASPTPTAPEAGGEPAAAPEACVAGLQPVADQGACLADAVCYRLADGGWCTGNVAKTERTCPDAWYENAMPGPEQPGALQQYLVVGGKRRELFEFDLEWVRANCPVNKPETVQ